MLARFLELVGGITIAALRCATFAMRRLQENVDDTRECAVLAIMRVLETRGTIVE